MVRCSNYHLNAVLSVVALGCALLNCIDNNAIAITSLAVFILTEAALFIKTIQCLRNMQFRFVAFEHICLFSNSIISLCISLVSIFDCIFSRHFSLFPRCYSVMALPVFCSAFLLYRQGSKVTYDLESAVRALKDRWTAKKPSMGLDVAIIDLEGGRRVRSYLPAYSDSTTKPPSYCMFEDDSPAYEDVFYDDLEESSLLGDSEEVSGGCIPSVCSGIPSYRASRYHKVVERGESREVIIDIEES